MAKVQLEKRKPTAFNLMQWLIVEMDDIIVSGSDGYYRSRSEFVEKKLLEAIEGIKDKEQLNTKVK